MLFCTKFARWLSSRRPCLAQEFSEPAGTSRIRMEERARLRWAGPQLRSFASTAPLSCRLPALARRTAGSGGTMISPRLTNLGTLPASPFRRWLRVLLLMGLLSVFLHLLSGCTLLVSMLLLCFKTIPRRAFNPGIPHPTPLLACLLARCASLLM